MTDKDVDDYSVSVSVIGRECDCKGVRVSVCEGACEGECDCEGVCQCMRKSAREGVTVEWECEGVWGERDYEALCQCKCKGV